MTNDEMIEVLTTRLDSFRAWSYNSLAERVEHNNRTGECLEHIKEVAPDGTPYQMEFNAYWGDKPHGDIRVCGSLSAKPRRRLLWFLPVYIPHVTDSFILSPDGCFLDEANEQESESDPGE